MKKIISLFICTILLVSCYSNDEDYSKNTINLNNPNLIKVYTLPTYNVGDKLYIESVFSKLQNESGYSNKLDVFKTTNSRQFVFGFNLQKKVFNGTYTYINLSSADFEAGGLGSFSDYNSPICELNQSNTNYEFYKGLILQEAGEYKLTIFNTLSNYNQSYNASDVNVSINTTVENIPSNEYIFTVN